MGRRGYDLRVSKLSKLKGQTWAYNYLRDLGDFAMFIARHFKKKVWRVDLALVKALDLTRQRENNEKVDTITTDDLDKLLSEDATGMPTDDELDAAFGKGAV